MKFSMKSFLRLIYTRAKVTGLVMNPVIFGTRFVFAFTHKETNPLPKITGFITNPNTSNTIKKSGNLNPSTFKSGIFLSCKRVFSQSEDFLRLLRPSRLDIVHSISKFFLSIRTYGNTETDFDYI